MALTPIAKTKDILQRTLGFFGLTIIVSGCREQLTIHRGFPKDMDSEFKPVYEYTKHYTLTTIESMYGLYKAIEYIVKTGVPGDVVECGVWKGGSAMLMAHTLFKMQNTSRKIYLYDTFAGMSKPTEKDVLISDGLPTMEEWKKQQKNNYNTWAFSPLEEVQNNMRKTGYPGDNIIYVKGKVEDTIPGTIPSQIAILRLDTDWYESTYHELKYLFPLLSHGGVVIIDDYGHFAGAREAVDTYFKENSISMLLSRIDYTGRVGVKTQCIQKA